jgi:exopolysaccharide biosynthesis polyprenyl glycosylphosphotransferase
VGLVEQAPSASPSHGRSDEAPRGPLLRRLNQRGFRLAHVADFIGMYTMLVAAMFVRFGWEWRDFSYAAYLGSFLFTVLMFQMTMYFGGLYVREPRLGRPSVLPRAARQASIAGGMVALAILGATGAARQLGITTERALPMPITHLVGLMVLAPIWVAFVRKAVALARTRREGPPRLLLVGDEADVLLARKHLDEAAEDRLVNVVGAVHDLEDAPDAARRRGATDVLLLSSDQLDLVQASILPQLEQAGRRLLLRVSAADTLYGLQRLREVGGLPFLLVGAQAMPPYRRRFKRLTDLGAVMILLPMLLPLLASTAAYVALRAGRPILFWQQRVGVGGATFRMVKFRTMRTDAEEDGRPRLAAAADDRVVKGCGFLRGMRLDELPQLWNILRGEMGLVGPRPERPELTAQFELSIPGYARRHEVPPGITGLAQIHGRYHTDAEYKLGYDLQYLVNWSPVLDAEILARTVLVVLGRRV